MVGDWKIWTGDGGEMAAEIDDWGMFGRIWKVGVVERDGSVLIVEVLFDPESVIDGVRSKG
jgi:hypothetical protein